MRGAWTWLDTEVLGVDDLPTIAPSPYQGRRSADPPAAAAGLARRRRGRAGRTLVFGTVNGRGEMARPRAELRLADVRQSRLRRRVDRRVVPNHADARPLRPGHEPLRSRLRGRAGLSGAGPLRHGGRCVLLSAGDLRVRLHAGETRHRRRLARPRPKARRRHSRSERIGQDDAAAAAVGRAHTPDGTRPARRRGRAIIPRAGARAADRGRPAGNVARVRLHGARNRADGPLSAPRRVRDRGAGRSGRRRCRARSDGHARARRSRVSHAQRRRKAARHHRVGARADWRTGDGAGSRLLLCSTNRRRRSICATSSRSARSLRRCATNAASRCCCRRTTCTSRRRSARRSSCCATGACSRGARLPSAHAVLRGHALRRRPRACPPSLGDGGHS